MDSKKRSNQRKSLKCNYRETSYFVLGIIFLIFGCAQKGEQEKVIFGIQPFSGNPYFWEYQGKPVLLLGGTWQDNLFNHTEGLEEHLDLLVAVGGNYVRNTMSHRNVGNVFAYERNEEGFFDLNVFNDDYWDRLNNFLRLCHEKNIIVQLEVWDPWDHYEDHQSFGGWSFHPFNPKNNLNYSSLDSSLPESVDYAPQTMPTEHPFFRTVPDLNNNELVLGYQQAYASKLLSISLSHPNVLYCINNESGEEVAWSNYWADFIHEQAKKTGIVVHVTDMRRNEDVRASDHAIVFQDPQRYTFLDISQNNAWTGKGQLHYDNILYVKGLIKNHPRPVNNIKNYGAGRHGEDETIARFCRMVFAGAASARFHRPHPLEDPKDHEASSDYGLGLSPKAQKIIQSMRQVTDKLELGKTNPRNDLLSERVDNEVYLLAEEGKQYALYFPLEADDGKVMLDLSGAKGKWKIEWVNISENSWFDEIMEIDGAEKVWIQKPENGHWAAVILPIEH